MDNDVLKQDEDGCVDLATCKCPKHEGFHDVDYPLCWHFPSKS